MVEFFGVSDVGLVRKQNQDRILIDDSVGLFVVADGMGGHVHGEVAAQVALSAIQYYIDSSRQRTNVSWPCGYSFDLSIDANRITTGIHLANRDIRREAQREPASEGMGTTVAAILVNETHAVVANVGDSRVYLYRQGDLKQLSVDDTWIGSMTAQGLIEQTEAENHPMRNMLMQAAGSKEQLEAEGGITIWARDGSSFRWSIFVRNRPDRVLFQAKGAGGVFHEVAFLGSQFKTSKGLKGDDARQLPIDLGLVRDNQIADLIARLNTPKFKMVVPKTLKTADEHPVLAAEGSTETVTIRLDGDFRPAQVRFGSATGLGSGIVTYSDYAQKGKTYYPQSMQIKPDATPHGVDVHFDRGS